MMIDLIWAVPTALFFGGLYASTGNRFWLLPYLAMLVAVCLFVSIPSFSCGE